MVIHSSSFVPIKASCFISYLFGCLCARVVSSLEGSLKPPLPLKLWFVSIELLMIAFVAILADDDNQHRNTEVCLKLPQKVFLRKVTFSDWQVALSILLIGHNSQVSISLVKSKCQSRCQSVQSSVRQVMMSVRCQPVRSWCLFHCKELKGSPLNPRLASNFSLCRVKCKYYHYNHNFSNQRITL